MLLGIWRAEPNAGTDCIETAELAIRSALSQLDEAARSPFLERVRAVARREENDASSESAKLYWVGVARHAPSNPIAD